MYPGDDTDRTDDVADRPDYAAERPDDRWRWVRFTLTGRFSMWVTYPIITFVVGFALAYLQP
ncbi:hypothetical protein HUN08_05500 [Gordonia sp. X0973]|uniref:hypothetical protein n=1 Tax=Gordonia sp. X0973 TaxID=2742602 RepID=UPI000F52912C|nr:hypothetical protein [Gordonia sp. X0973]QKT06703.1 hypothetical protein HUN08_05500 [Gordonia sp. X0973]